MAYRDNEDKIIAIMRDIFAKDKKILASRDRLLEALKAASESSPDISRDLSSVITAVEDQNIGEVFFVAEEMHSEEARDAARKKARAIMSDDMHMQDARVEFVENVFEKSLEWDKPIIFEDNYDDDGWDADSADEETEAQDVAEEAADGTWNCVCGKTGITSKFCVNCGRSRADGDVMLHEHQGNQPEAERPPESVEPLVRAEGTVSPKSAAESAEFVSDAPKKKINKKPFIVAAAVVLIVIIGFIVYGTMNNQKYEAKSKELITVSSDISKIIEDIGKLNGDPASDDTKKVVARLNDASKKIETLHGDIQKIEPPDDLKSQKEPLLTFMERERDVLKQTADILSYDKLLVDTRNLQEITEKVSNYIAAVNSLSSLSDAKVNGQNAKNLVDYEKLNHALGGYLDKKRMHDKEYADKKFSRYRKEVADKNEEEIKSKEVVFLTDNVQRSGNDILIYGTFYNGTKDIVSSIKNMLVDVTLYSFDDEVLSLKDVSFQDPNLAHITLSQNSKTGQVIIRLSGKATNDDFNHFAVNVHKIHWTVRRAKK